MRALCKKKKKIEKEREPQQNLESVDTLALVIQVEHKMHG